MNSTEQKYNCWSNHETWLASLWLGDKESSYDLLLQALKVSGETYDKANWLESCLRQQLDQEIDVACLWRDLLRSAFDRISWLEIIEKNLE